MSPPIMGKREIKDLVVRSSVVLQVLPYLDIYLDTFSSSKAAPLVRGWGGIRNLALHIATAYELQ